jgi:hypothetical protein
VVKEALSGQNLSEPSWFNASSDFIEEELDDSDNDNNDEDIFSPEGERQPVAE